MKKNKIGLCAIKSFLSCIFVPLKAEINNMENKIIVLHTSDWHLGRTLYTKKQRYSEHEKFLHWLIDTIQSTNTDVLIVAGDIFDNATPGSRSQELYYNFLIRLKSTACRHVVIVAGNHDSPSFIDAPKKLLAALNVIVVGSIAENPADEVFVLKDENDRPELIVCAVPYLRERDIRTSEEGETIADKDKKIREGIRKHYADVAEIAENRRKETHADIPVIATGHLFAVGGQTTQDDGVREIYVGNLGDVGAEIFPPVLDYVALGHLHIPQKVNKSEHIRYSGSPIPMGFGECKQQKQLNLISFENRRPVVETIPIPVFQKLESIKGDRENILQGVRQLGESNENCWIEVIYTGEEIWGNMVNELENEIESYPALEIIRYRNQKLFHSVLEQEQENEILEDLDITEVFNRCLESNAIPPEQRKELSVAYSEIIQQIML
jgi:exonuclease SbcD